MPFQWNPVLPQAKTMLRLKCANLLYLLQGRGEQ